MQAALPLTYTLTRPWVLVKARFRSWWQSRLPLSDTITLTYNNVYILPTRPGFMLAATLLVLLVASINYQLNLGYLLTFLLAGSALVGMHVCHGNLRGIALHLVPPDPQWMGSNATFGVTLASEKKSTRHSIALAVLDATHEDHWSWTDVPAQGSVTVQVAFKPERRGLHRVPAVTAETRFPLGNFRVWMVWRPASQVLVYPLPEPHAPPLPPGEPRAGGAASARLKSSGDFDGVRAYQRGDPMKLVVWKLAAKGMARGSDELVSRDTEQAQRHELWLDYIQTGANDPEARISRLTAWVLRADKQALDYGLRLPGREIKPANGEAHRRACLEALALA